MGEQGPSETHRIRVGRFHIGTHIYFPYPVIPASTSPPAGGAVRPRRTESTPFELMVVHHLNLHKI